MRKRIVSVCVLLAAVITGICVCYYGDATNRKIVFGNAENQVAVFEMESEYASLAPRLNLYQKTEEFVMEKIPWASWNPNGTYVIEDGEIVGTERNGKDIYHFEIEDDETLVFNAQGDEYSLIPDGSVFKLKIE